MSVPGIGPIISSAVVAAIGTGDAFSKGRDFAAWLGLVPKQISTGDRTILGKISKRGNRYLRVLFVQAAWVVLIKPKSWERHGLKHWIEAAKKRSSSGWSLLCSFFFRSIKINKGVADRCPAKQRPSVSNRQHASVGISAAVRIE